jgi:transketolase
LFERESKQYQEQILPKNVKTKIAVEMSDAVHYYKYVGTTGALVNITQFGQSAKAQDVMVNYGFTVEHVVNRFIDCFKANQ